MALPTVDQLYSQALQGIQGYGNAEKNDLYQNYQNALGGGMQSLASSGLAGTSIAPSMKMGYMKQYQNALNTLSQQLQQTTLGAQQTFGLGGIGLQQGQEGLNLQQQSITNQLALGQRSLNLQQQGQKNQMTLGLGAMNQNQGYLSLAQQQQSAQQNMQNQQLQYQYATLNQGGGGGGGGYAGSAGSMGGSYGAAAGFAGFGGY
jgi:hypothetical protein